MPSPHSSRTLSDPLPLAQDLIRRPSVTPEDAGALDVLAEALGNLGFEVHDLRFSDPDFPEIRNLYARLGTSGPNLCFAGHTDVVPVGKGWSVDPFAGEVRDGVLYGRGAADMKAAIAAWVAAVADRQETNGAVPGSISLLITGDEEGPAVNGTRKVLNWLAERGERLDACIVGEPTNPNDLGDMIKIGRRGSLNGIITVRGAQGHVAYPHLAENPIPRLMRMLQALLAEPLDRGNVHFQRSNLEITTIDVGNGATNIIPGIAQASFNIRFNDIHSGASLVEWVSHKLDKASGGEPGRYDFTYRIAGESFLTPPGKLSTLLVDAIKAETGRVPELSTTGGTSDARFIKDACPVVEFGLVGQTMHKTDERCGVDDIHTLARIYRRVIDGFFS